MIHDIIAEYMTAQYLQAEKSKIKHIKTKYRYVMDNSYIKEDGEVGSATNPSLASKIYGVASKSLCDLNNYSFPIDNWTKLYSDNEYDMNCPYCLEFSQDLYDSKIFHSEPTK